MVFLEHLLCTIYCVRFFLTYTCHGGVVPSQSQEGLPYLYVVICWMPDPGGLNPICLSWEWGVGALRCWRGSAEPWTMYHRDQDCRVWGECEQSTDDPFTNPEKKRGDTERSQRGDWRFSEPLEEWMVGIQALVRPNHISYFYQSEGFLDPSDKSPCTSEFQ